MSKACFSPDWLLYWVVLLTPVRIEECEYVRVSDCAAIGENKRAWSTKALELGSSDDKEESRFSWWRSTPELLLDKLILTIRWASTKQKSKGRQFETRQQ